MTGINAKVLAVICIILINTMFRSREVSALEKEESRPCYRKQIDIFQVSFIYDRTMSYYQFGKQFINEIFPHFAANLTGDFPLSEFAIATFADYTIEQSPKPIPRWRRQKRDASSINTDKSKGCYERIQPFTNNEKETVVSFNSIKAVKTGGSGESSLTAIYFTTTDKMLNWKEAVINYGELPPETPALYKVIVLLTDEISTIKFSDGEEDRVEPIGDGSDNCLTTQIPTAENIKEVFGESKMTSIVGLFNVVAARPNLKDVWSVYFKTFGIPHNIILRSDNVPGPDIAKKLIAAIKDSIGEECVFEAMDPPSYNTLGL